jgi:hypothetical protein
MKIYLQNPEKTQIAVFDSENQRGEGFVNWINLTQDEITQYLLKEAKNKKLANLNKFYNSSECWIYTLFSNLTKTYASLTRDANFFGKCLLAGAGNKLSITTDNNIVVEYDLSVEKAQILNFQINILNGEEIKRKKLELENKINLANNIEIINSIDIETELLNAVERNIDLDKFN